MQELRPDAVIEPDPPRDFDIGTHDFAQVGDFVDEGDLHRQNAFAAYLISSAVRRRVNSSGASLRYRGRHDGAGDLARRIVLDPDDDPVGPLEIANAAPSRRNRR